jgi:hypothetical protein
MAQQWIRGTIERDGRNVPFHWCLQWGRLFVNCAGQTKRADRAMSGSHQRLAGIIAGELYRQRPE